MIEEHIHTLPAMNKRQTSVKGDLIPSRQRFTKAAPNADHPYTVRMRAIKDELRITTRQLVRELNVYESAFHAKNYHLIDVSGNAIFLPMKYVLLTSYLQGWVVQDVFMKAILERLENFCTYKKSLDKPEKDIRTIMDGWFADLGIATKVTNVSPYRQLATKIAPYYKRPVLASVEGVFHLMPAEGDTGVFTITDATEEVQTFYFNLKERLLVKNGQALKVGDVIQYSVLMQTKKVGDQVIATNAPSDNHTTFYRWYSKNRMPLSMKTIELVQAAVNAAVLAKTKATDPSSEKVAAK